MRRFLKEDGHASSYADVNIVWVGGASPSVKITNDDGSVDGPIDITGFSTESLHDLLTSRGFKKLSSEPSNQGEEL